LTNAIFTRPQQSLARGSRVFVGNIFGTNALAAGGAQGAARRSRAKSATRDLTGDGSDRLRHMVEAMWGEFQKLVTAKRIGAALRAIGFGAGDGEVKNKKGGGRGPPAVIIFEGSRCLTTCCRRLYRDGGELGSNDSRDSRGSFARFGDCHGGGDGCADFRRAPSRFLV